MVTVEDALPRIVDAHGGLDYWNSLSSVDVEFSANGFLFAAKRVPPLQHARITLDTRTPHVVTHDYPVPGQRSILYGCDRIEIRDADDTVVAARVDPRQAFGRRTLLRWDALDFAYFSSYAMWNYLCLPFLLTYPGVSVRQMPGNQTVLSADFPVSIPTHSPTQEFHFDESGLLIRHDYTAEVVGSWARAAHLCTEYRGFGGLRVSTVRRVYPRGPLGRPLPFPTLVAIDIHDVHPRTTRRS